jgi:hypothetical protein
MTAPSWTWADFGVGMTLVALFGIAAFAAGVWYLIDLRRLMLTQPTVSGHELFAPFAGILLGTALMLMAYLSSNEQRLLRGECRYTIARVYENRRIKGDKVSRLEYWVAGERYECKERMDWRGGWRPLHSRWYVRFAVPDPDVYEYTDIPVPDSVRVVPATGWASLPQPPAPEPTPALAPAAEPAPSAPVTPKAAPAPAPLTGPAASPVFEATRPDSAARPAGNPLIAPSPTFDPLP